MINFKILASGLTILLALLLLNTNNNNSKKKIHGGFKNNSELLNIYDEPLKPCGTKNMGSGSWDSEFKCSEKDGGVHQICINNIANNAKKFSIITGQTNWSDKRNNNNHCVCLGAWSLYNAKQKKNKPILKCESIPKMAFSQRYVKKFSEGWNKWNGLELDNQIKDGVESLFKMCYKNDKKSDKLRINYCKFAKNIEVLKNSQLYNKTCN